jgi:hypothetical protein
MRERWWRCERDGECKRVRANASARRTLKGRRERGLWSMLARILHVLHSCTYSSVIPLAPPPPPPPQDALSSSLIASSATGPHSTCICRPEPSSRVDPDLPDHKAGALAYTLHAALAGIPARLGFTYGAGGYSSAALGVLDP